MISHDIAYCCYTFLWRINVCCWETALDIYRWRQRDCPSVAAGRQSRPASILTWRVETNISRMTYTVGCSFDIGRILFCLWTSDQSRRHQRYDWFHSVAALTTCSHMRHQESVPEMYAGPTFLDPTVPTQYPTDSTQLTNFRMDTNHTTRVPDLTRPDPSGGFRILFSQAYGPFFSRGLNHLCPKIFSTAFEKTAMLTCKITLPDAPYPVIISKNP